MSAELRINTLEGEAQSARDIVNVLRVLAMDAVQKAVPVRLVSLPATSVFDRQPRSHRERVLPPDLPCVAIEAGVTDSWRKYVDRRGEVLGMSTFGESAPAGELFRHFGFTAAHAVEAVRRVLAD